MLRSFQEIKIKRASHVGPPQSLFSNTELLTHRGEIMEAKSSIICVRPSPRVIRNNRIKAVGILRKFVISSSLGPNRVSPNVYVRSKAKKRRKTNHASIRLEIRGRTESAVRNNLLNRSIWFIIKRQMESWKSCLLFPMAQLSFHTNPRIDIVRAPVTETRA